MFSSEDYLNGHGSKSSSRTGSPISSDDIPVTEKQLDMQVDPVSKNDLTGFIDLTYFKRLVSLLIFTNVNNFMN